MEPEILYEDSYILAINKPAGMVVNRAESVKGETVQDWAERRLGLEVRGEKWEAGKRSGKWENRTSHINNLASHIPPHTSDYARRAGIVHRIDKETSGVLLIAKTADAFRELQRQFKEREVEKEYVALVHGRVEPPEGTIKAPVGRLPWNRERFGVLAGGREAETHYRVTAHYALPPTAGGAFTTKPTTHYTLLTLKPRTGRTHQIRVHAKSINHPIVADTFYAGRKTARRDRQWCSRLFLHASRIAFKHPQTSKRVVVEASLPEELLEALDTLER